MGNSLQQDIAAQIKEAKADVVKATQAYRKGGSLDAVNKANRKLADATDDLYCAAAGLHTAINDLPPSDDGG